MMNQYAEIYDELLVIKSKQGDNQAFDELVARWQERLWRYAFKLTGSDADAWDVVQETWCEIVKELTKLRDTALFHCWAFRILNNKCTDLFRKQQRQSRLNKEVAERQQKLSDMPKNSDERKEFLTAAIGKLPPNRRVLVVLRYFNNFGTNQMAEILGIPEGTVKSRLHRTVDQLHQMMR